MFIYNSSVKYEEYIQKSEEYLTIDSYYNDFSDLLKQIMSSVKSTELTKEQFVELDNKVSVLIAGYNDYVSKFSMDDCVRYQFDINEAHYLASNIQKDIMMLSDEYSQLRKLKKDSSASKTEIKKLEDSISKKETEITYGKKNLYVGKFLYYSKITKNCYSWLALKIASFVFLAIGIGALIYGNIVLVRYIKIKKNIRTRNKRINN